MRNLRFSKNLNKRNGKFFYVLYHQAENWMDNKWLGKLFWNKNEWVMETEKGIFTKEELGFIIKFIEDLL